MSFATTLIFTVALLTLKVFVALLLRTLSVPMFVIVIVYVPAAKSGLTILSSVVVLNTVSLSSFMIIISMVVGVSTLNSIETFP